MATGVGEMVPNAEKGYGFIQPDDGGKDVFVHISALERAGMPGLQKARRNQIRRSIGPR